MADELLEVSGQALARESEIHQSTPIGFLIGCSAQIGFKWHHAWYLEMCQNCGIKIGGVTSIKNIIFTLFFHVEEFQHGIPPISHQPQTTHNSRSAGEKLGQLREDLMHPLQPKQHSRQVVSRLLAFSRKAFEHVNWIAAGTKSGNLGSSILGDDETWIDFKGNSTGNYGFQPHMWVFV